MMVSMKDRVVRLEVRSQVVVDDRQVREDAEAVVKNLERMQTAFSEADAAITLEERLARMSVAEHVAWSARFVPGFSLDADTLERFMAMHADVRARLVA